MKLYQTTHKTNHKTIKTSKKHFLVMFKNNPLFFIHFLFFSTCIFLLQLLCFVENTIKIVCSEEHSLSKAQLVRATIAPIPKTPFLKKRCHFWFWAVSAETTIFKVFPGFIVLAPKNFWPKQIVFTSVRQFLQKNPFFEKPLARFFVHESRNIWGHPCLRTTQASDLLVAGAEKSEEEVCFSCVCFDCFNVFLVGCTMKLKISPMRFEPAACGS